jgi:hypothetical protein
VARNVVRWICDICGRVVDDGAGGLICNLAGADELLAARRQWDDEHLRGPGEPLKVVVMTEYATYPPDKTWRVAHFDCLPDGATIYSDYCIEVDQIRTPEQVVAWTAHLMTKTWLPLTNWHATLQGLANKWGTKIG